MPNSSEIMPKDFYRMRHNNNLNWRTIYFAGFSATVGIVSALVFSAMHDMFIAISYVVFSALFIWLMLFNYRIKRIENELQRIENTFSQVH